MTGRPVALRDADPGACDTARTGALAASRAATSTWMPRMHAARVMLKTLAT
jgi:hypothetical protein